MSKFQGIRFRFPRLFSPSHLNPLPGIRQSGYQSAEQGEASGEADQTEEQTDPGEQSLERGIISDYHILLSLMIIIINY